MPEDNQPLQPSDEASAPPYRLPAESLQGKTIGHLSKQTSSHGRKLGCAAATVLIFTIAALFIYALLSKLIELPGEAVDKTAQIANQTKNVLVELFQLNPKIINNNTIVFEENQSITELAVISRKTQVSDEFEHSFLGSTKRIRVEGLFVIKAGFDLNEPFCAVIENNTVTLYMPPTRILSVEQKKVEVNELRNGIWNKILPEDLEERVNLLAALARQKMQTGGLDAEAHKFLLDSLSKRLGPEVIVRIKPSTKSAPAEQPAPKK